jgi:hypothetical protein
VSEYESSFAIRGGGAPLRSAGVVLTENLDPNIVMMQPAQDWQRPDVPNCLEVPKVRSVLVQR